MFWHVARFTLRDLIRSKIMWNIPLLGSLFALLTFVAREFTYGVPERVATNLGLGILTVSLYGIAFFAGVTLVRSEAESRTIYLIISRPVTRTAFLVGKIFGVTMFFAINATLLSCIGIAILWAIGGVLNDQVVVAALFIILEAVLLLTMIVVLSMVSNIALTIMLGLILLIAGHAVAVTIDINWLAQFPWLQAGLKNYHWIFPAFYKLNFKDYAVYSMNFPWERVMSAVAYWFCYNTALLSIGCGIINYKDFD